MRSRAYIRSELERRLELLRQELPKSSDVELEGRVVERLEAEGFPRRILFELRLERATRRDESRSQ